MSSEGRSASGRDGDALLSPDSAPASDRLIALERQLLNRIDRADRLSDDLIASQAELARKETLLVATAARADSAEREQAQSVGRAAAMLDEVTRRREEAASMARDLAATADRIARAEREAEVRTRHAELVASEAKDLRKRLTDKDELLSEARALLAEERARRAQEASAPVPAPSPPGVVPARRSLKKRLGPFAVLAAPLLLFRKRPKAVKVRALPAPKSDQEAMDLIARSDLFDGEWYLNKYPDIRAAGVEPLHHYFHHGGTEGRKPGPRFDPRWYAEHVRGLSGNPLIHYLTQGRAQGIEIPGLDAAPVHDHPDVLEIVNTPLFDPDWYRARRPGLPKGREHVAHHYLTSGWLEGFQPGPLFDGDAYLKRYEDVREAGANPLLHYLRHGRGERREAFPVQGEGSRRAALDPFHPLGQSGQQALFDSAADVNAPDDAATDPWVWLRADDFGDAAEGHVDVRLGERLLGRTRAPIADLDATLKTFARLTGLATFEQGDARGCFATGAGRLVRDAWFLTSLDLRLRLALPQGGPCVVRAYQTCLDGSGLSRLEEAALDPSTVTIIDLTLTNPFAAVLLCVDDGHGLLLEASILCFPSLARGGLHHGELVAADAQDDLASHDACLATQWLDTAGGPLAISAIEVDTDGVIGGEAIFGPLLQDWLKTAMRLSVTARDGNEPAAARLADLMPAPVRDPRIAAFGPERSGPDGCTLVIPGDAVPTLAALVGRASTGAAGNGPGPVILADAIRSRPRWHVTPPAGLDRLSDLQPRTGGNPWPLLRGARAPDAGESDPSSRPPLAIRFRENPDASHDRVSIFQIAPDRPGPLLKRAPAARAARVSVVIGLDANTGLDDLAATLGSLAAQDHGGTLEVVLVTAHTAPDALTLARDHFANAREVVDPSSTAARWNAGAARAKGRFLLFVEAGMVLHDPRTLETLLTIAGTDGLASAGCATIQAAHTADPGRKLSLHGAGVFPDQIAFRTGPQLMLGEPTTSAALAPASYAVAANRFRLTLIPRAAWDALEGLDAAACPEKDYDLDFGVRALKLGLIHVCTTVVVATRLGGNPLGRAGALSRARLSMTDWAGALAKMTIVRALG